MENVRVHKGKDITKDMKSNIHIGIVDPISKEKKVLFEDFIKSLKIAGEKIKEIYPQYLMISLNGGLPLYECLSIIDRDLAEQLKDINNVVYFPASSKIQNSGVVVQNCFENFLLEKFDESNRTRKIVSLDEVLGGGSVCRLLNGYHYASRQLARRNLKRNEKEIKQEYVDDEAQKIRERMPYKIVGLREERPSAVISKEYQNYIDEGTVIEIPVKEILTLDNEKLQIIKWDHPNSSGYVGSSYWPRIKGFDVKDSYLDFLRKVASYVGVNPATVSGPILAEKIRSDCAKYSKKPKQ